MDPPHSLYHLITELRTASLLCFIGNFTIRFHSSNRKSLREETCERLARKDILLEGLQWNQGLSARHCLDKDIWRRHVKLTTVDVNSWETLASDTMCVESGWSGFRCLIIMEINGLYGAWVPQELARCCTGVLCYCHPQVPPSCLLWPWLASCTSSRYPLKQWTANRCRAHWKLSLQMSFGVRLSSILQTSLGTVVRCMYFPSSKALGKYSTYSMFILPSQDFLCWSCKNECHLLNPLLTKACLVNTAGYWPCSYLYRFWPWLVSVPKSA